MCAITEKIIWSQNDYNWWDFSGIQCLSSVYLSFRLNHRLIEIFGCDGEKAFTGLPGILCGDFYWVDDDYVDGGGVWDETYYHMTSNTYVSLVKNSIYSIYGQKWHQFTSALFCIKTFTFS